MSDRVFIAHPRRPDKRDADVFMVAAAMLSGQKVRVVAPSKAEADRIFREAQQLVEARGHADDRT